MPPKRSCLLIQHPQPFETMTALPYHKDKKEFYFFTASGRCHGLENLAGCIIDQDDPYNIGGQLRYKVYPGRLIKPDCGCMNGVDLHWVMGFYGLPKIDGDKKKKFHLFVGQVSCEQSDMAAQSDTVATAGNRAISVEFFLKTQDPTHGPIQILYPISNSTVASSFTAWGINGDAAPDNATMEIGNTVKIFGTKMNAPTGNWLFQFTNIPENSGYTLYAYNDDDDDTGEQNNITVNGLALPPIPAPPPPEPPPPLLPGP